MSCLYIYMSGINVNPFNYLSSFYYLKKALLYDDLVLFDEFAMTLASFCVGEWGIC